MLTPFQATLHRAKLLQVHIRFAPVLCVGSKMTIDETEWTERSCLYQSDLE